jgi:hypothetical protein
MPHTNVKSEWVDGNLTFSDKDGYVVDFKAGAVGAQHGAVVNIRKRFTIAEVNAGATILPAIAGRRYRMVDAAIIAVGGNAAAHTSIDILGTVSTSRKLVAFLVAGTTQSTLLRAGAATNGVLLADGASFTQNDANTAITVSKTGSDVTTATHVDIHFSFVVE